MIRATILVMVFSCFVAALVRPAMPDVVLDDTYAPVSKAKAPPPRPDLICWRNTEHTEWRWAFAAPAPWWTPAPSRAGCATVSPNPCIEDRLGDACEATLGGGGDGSNATFGSDECGSETGHGSRSGLGDGTNPGQGSGRENSPDQGTDNPGQGSGRENYPDQGTDNPGQDK